VTTAFGQGRDYAFGVVVQPDQRIVGGGTSSPGGTAFQVFASARYLTPWPGTLPPLLVLDSPFICPVYRTEFFGGLWGQGQRPINGTYVMLYIGHPLLAREEQ
jgi:hypothetical protein